MKSGALLIPAMLPGWFSYLLPVANRILQRYFSITFREVTAIRKTAPINLIVHCPRSKEGKEQLAKRVSEIHAAAVTQRIKSLNCPTTQKLELLDAVIETVKERSKEQT